MIEKIRRFIRLPLSRKIQTLEFFLARMKTNTYYRWRLKQCGCGNIIQRPLFWTPEFISIGNNVMIWKGCRIEAVGRFGDMEFRPHIQIGDHVSFQQNCHLVAADSLSIGSNTTISVGVLIIDSDHEYTEPRVNVLQQPLKVKQIRIGENCFLGAGAKIQSGTILGDHCVVGANAVVRGIFPDYCVIVGMPGRIVKRLDPATGTWRNTDISGEFIND